jgi:serine palmitoyltransferase
MTEATNASPIESVAHSGSKASSPSNKAKKSRKHKDASEGTVDRVTMIIVILNYALMMMWGYIREGFRYLFPDPDLAVSKGYAPLLRGSDDFFSRRMYRRVRDCWNRPINTRAGRVIGVMERVSDSSNKTFTFTGKTIPAINLASYNYLGFSEDLPQVTADNLVALERFGTGACMSSQEGGQTTILRDLEEETAEFLGKEAAVVYAMGFVTNFSGLAPLFCKETLVVSDSLNHASLVAGVRTSFGRVKVFKHNDMKSLDRIVRLAICEGQPRTHKPWKRIVIVVEGVTPWKARSSTFLMSWRSRRSTSAFCMWTRPTASARSARTAAACATTTTWTRRTWTC